MKNNALKHSFLNYGNKITYFLTLSHTEKLKFVSISENHRIKLWAILLDNNYLPFQTWPGWVLACYDHWDWPTMDHWMNLHHRWTKSHMNTLYWENQTLSIWSCWGLLLKKKKKKWKDMVLQCQHCIISIFHFGRAQLGHYVSYLAILHNGCRRKACVVLLTTSSRFKYGH